MKISINPSAIQYVSKSSQKVSDNGGQKSTVNSKQNVSTDRVSSSSANSMQTMQQKYIDSQKMFGALTQLSEALELFRQQPSKFEQNMKEIIAKVRRDFPQLSKYVESLENIDKVSKQLEVAKSQLSTEMKTQKKDIATQLIMEQNKQAVKHNPATVPSPKDVMQQLAAANVSRAHTSRVDQVTKLLS